MKSRAIVAGVLAAASLGLPYALAAPSEAPAWVPDKALIGQLAPPKSVDAYHIQPPRSYTLQTARGPGGSNAESWVSPVRADGTRGYLMLVLVTPPPGDAHKYTLRQALTKFLGSVAGRRTDWKQTPTEQGVVNGMAFVRAYWSGTDRTTGQKMHGFNYVSQTDTTIIQLSSQDMEPHDKAALALAEATALTFKRE